MVPPPKGKIGYCVFKPGLKTQKTLYILIYANYVKKTTGIMKKYK